jgi:hypothetical protein
VIGRAVEAEVDPKGNRGPSGILCAAIEAELYEGLAGCGGHVEKEWGPTRLAGFSLSLAKMFCDSVLLARAAMATGVEDREGEREQVDNGTLEKCGSSVAAGRPCTRLGHRRRSIM